MTTRPAWLPSEEQELLLRAALLRDERAEASWVRWRERNVEEQFEIASFRLLPLVYKNLAAVGSDDPWMGRLKGIYRRSWFLNQPLLHRAAGLVESLESAGIPTLLLKGAGLSLAHYRDTGVRPMDDVDVAVPAAQAWDAIRVLQRDGLTAEYALTEDALELRHADTLLTPDGHRFDLHWSLLWQGGDDSDFWDAAVPVEIGPARTPTRTLCAPDQVVHVCGHGAYWSNIHPLRWVADVHAVLSSAPEGIDWDRLVRSAAEHELTLPLHEALSYVGSRFDVAVPADALAALRNGRVRPLRRAAHRTASLPPSRLRSASLVLLYADAYRTRARLSGQRPGPRGFMRYVQRQVHMENSRQLAGRLAHSMRHGPERGDVPVVARRADSRTENGS